MVRDARVPADHPVEHVGARELGRDVERAPARHSHPLAQLLQDDGLALAREARHQHHLARRDAGHVARERLPRHPQRLGRVLFGARVHDFGVVQQRVAPGQVIVLRGQRLAQLLHRGLDRLLHCEGVALLVIGRLRQRRRPGQHLPAVAAALDQLAVGLRVQAARGVVQQVGQVRRAAHLLELAHAAQLLNGRQVVDGLPAPVQALERLEDERVLDDEKVARRQLAVQVEHRVRVDQDAPQQRLFGLN